MRADLTEAQIASYRENGFLVVEGFLDAAELDEWRHCTDVSVEQRLGDTKLHNQRDPDAYYARVFTQCLRLADTHPGMRRLLFDPSLGEMAATLAGVDGIQCLLSSNE